MNSKHVTISKLILPGHISFLEMALSFIDNATELFKFSEQEILQIRLASEEAISNIMKHALSNNIKESFEIKCIFKDTQFEIVIHEKGKPFDPQKIAQYNPNSANIEGSTEGLGTFLMQKVMDKVEFKNMGREGKETILIKYPKSQKIDNILNISSKVQTRIKDFSFIVREFRDDDAIGVSECAYSAYRYTYEPYIYYPEQIIKMNKEHKLRSFVAQSNDGNIAGHAALKYTNNFIAEIGVAFVKQEYRGKNILRFLADYVFKSAETTSELKCLFGQVVTSHTISQDVLLKRDFTPTAITLALFPADVDFKSISGEVSQKDAALILCLNTKHDDKVKDIYIPKRHEKITKDIFNALGYKINTKKTSRYKQNSCDTKLEYQIMDIFNCGWIRCSNYSSKSIYEVHNTVKTLCLNRVDAIYLYLDLEDENMPHLAKECEEFGFFFAGILPYAINGNHAMIFQYLNNLIFDFDAITISGKRAEILKEYIHNCYNETNK